MIPQAMGQESPWATTTEAYALQQEKPLTREAGTLPLESSPRSQLEKACAQQWRPESTSILLGTHLFFLTPTILLRYTSHTIGFPGGSDSKVSVCNVGDLGSIPGSGRFPREGNGNPLQYSCLENPMDRGAWLAIVHGVAKSWRRLSDFSFFPSHTICRLFNMYGSVIFSIFTELCN